MKILHWLLSFFNRPSGFNPAMQDERDEEYQLLGGIFGYKPKKTKVNNWKDWQEVHYQNGLGTCVTESISVQKEPDENVRLSPQDMAMYLRSIGRMTNSGTSLSDAQHALKKRGIAEWSMLPHNYTVGWAKFSDPKSLTQEIKINAGKHLSKSYWKTYSLGKLLEELDGGKIGHTGLTWYSGYNFYKKAAKNAILTPYSGRAVYGHAVAIIGYDLDLEGEKVLICMNSYGTDYGHSGKFYVRFKDLGIFKWGTYFNDDLPKNTIGFLSMLQNKAIKELNGPKIYYIEGKKKRHIPDEAMMLMLGFHHQDFVPGKFLDEDNVLPDVEEGKPMSLEDVHPDDKKNWEELVIVFPRLKESFKKYFN